MTEDYEGISFKNLGISGGIILLTTAAVLLIYGWVNGFSYLKQSLTSASQVMVAGFTRQTAPPLPTYVPLQTIMAQNGAAGNPPAAAQSTPRQYNTGTAAGQTGSTTGQYVCPTHGAVGAPLYSAGGVAQCPLCGQVMQFNCLTTNTALAAWNSPGGGGGGGG